MIICIDLKLMFRYKELFRYSERKERRAWISIQKNGFLCTEIQYMEKRRKNMTKKKAGMVFTSFGMGSVLSFYYYILFQNWILSSRERIQEVIKSRQTSVDMASIHFFSIILPIGILCLFLAPIWIMRNRKTELKLSIFLMFTIMSVAGNVIAVSIGKLSLFYIMVVWIFSIYFCFLLIEGIHAICYKMGIVLKFSTK